MTRRALTALALTATATGITSWWAATLWWGRCASGCRRGASIGAGAVSAGVPRPQNGSQDDPRECGWLGCGHPSCADLCNGIPLDEYRTWREAAS